MMMSPFKLLTTLLRKLSFKPHILFALLSSYAFLLGFLPILADTTVPLAAAVSGWFVLVLALQMVLLGWLSGRNSGGAARWLAAVLLVANLVAFFGSFFSDFLSLPGGQKIALFVALAVVARLLLGVASARPQLGRIVMLIVALNMAVAVGSEVTGGGDHSRPAASVARTTQAGEMPDLPRYSAVRLANRPNIHLIAIDSLLPDALAVKHMGIHARYQAVFAEAGATIVPNLFSSQSPTSQSLASVGRFADPDYSGHHAFSGRVLQPLYYLFRHNGYRIAAGYSSGKKSFGAQGPYVDEYVNTSGLARIFSESALCKHQSERGRTFQLYGLCRWVTPLERHNRRGWGQQVTEKIASKGGDGPWLTFHYIYRLLGHSAMDFQSDSDEDLAEYVTFFEKQQQTMMVPWARELIAQVHATDPNAIVFVFGDHGPYLSRSITQADNPTFYAQDRFGIFGAVLPTTQPCAAAEHLTHYADPYATPSRVLAGVIRCLAEDPQTVDQAMRFKELIDFSPFLYQ